MKYFTQILLLQFVFTIFVSTQVFALPIPLHGTWNSKCEIDGAFYKFISIEIHEDVWTKTIWWTSDDRCENITLEQQTMFSAVLSPELWTGKTLMAYIRPYTQEKADLFNHENLCGRNNWKHGRIIEVTNLACKNFSIPAYDEIFTAHLKIEGPRNNMLWLNDVLYLLDPGTL